MRLGVDLGGTKTEIIALDAGGQEIWRKRCPTPRNDYNGTVQTIARLVREAEQHLHQSGSLGIGIPGALSRKTGRVKNANSTWLNGRPLKEDLEQLLQRPVRIENDANCFALSEATDGAAAGYHNVFGVILGTGVGGGIVIDGKCVVGSNAIGGEWGHNPLPWPDPSWGEWPRPACYCGRQGCIETFLSGPALTATHPDGLSPQDIVKRATEGCDLCHTLLYHYQVRLAKALALVINILDPEVIVLGGGMSETDSLYQIVPELWQDYVFSDVVTTRLVRARFGPSSGVRGAAWLWPAAQAEGN
tara:strand:- start:7240 stop:8148 length:909 start_codon:yes stop_codon:yes gene_type:complete